jgi:hypothetical protein
MIPYARYGFSDIVRPKKVKHPARRSGVLYFMSGVMWI